MNNVNGYVNITEVSEVMTWIKEPSDPLIRVINYILVNTLSRPKLKSTRRQVKKKKKKDKEIR